MSLLPPVSRRFLVGLFFYPEDGGDTFLRNTAVLELHRPG
jgi:hypothetical protein